MTYKKIFELMDKINDEDSLKAEFYTEKEVLHNIVIHLKMLLNIKRLEIEGENNESQP